MREGARLIVFATLVGASACRSEPDTPSTKTARAPERTSTAPETKRSSAESPPAAGLSAAWRIDAPGRVVALGDLHGDVAATRAALRLAKVMNEDGRWVGGNTVLVQTGDQLDRGDDERAILELLTSLATQAEQAGGAVHVLNGNHEFMNALGDFRYVTPGAVDDFGTTLEERAQAFSPGGTWAQTLSRRPVVLVVDDTVFAHGGLLPEHVEKLDWLNEQSQKFLAGKASDPNAVLQALMAQDSPIWTRTYGQAVDATACAALEQTLAALQVKRLVIGHTVQPQGVTSACDGKVWRIDVGMSSHYGGKPQALEIEGGEVRVLAK